MINIVEKIRVYKNDKVPKGRFNLGQEKFLSPFNDWHCRE